MLGRKCTCANDHTHYFPSRYCSLLAEQEHCNWYFAFPFFCNYFKIATSYIDLSLLLATLSSPKPQYSSPRTLNRSCVRSFLQCEYQQCGGEVSMFYCHDVCSVQLLPAAPLHLYHHQRNHRSAMLSKVHNTARQDSAAIQLTLEAVILFPS